MYDLEQGERLGELEKWQQGFEEAVEFVMGLERGNEDDCPAEDRGPENEAQGVVAGEILLFGCGVRDDRLARLIVHCGKIGRSKGERI